MGTNLLIVVEDGQFASELAAQLSGFGHICEIVGDGAHAWKMITTRKYDAVILDRKLPTLDGMSLVSEMRAAQIEHPVLMLSAMGRVQDKVDGLNAGANDYIVKPANLEELNARINAQIRPRKLKNSDQLSFISFGNLKIDPLKYSITCNNMVVHLQNVEMKILMVLAKNYGNIVTRAMLFERVWNYDFEPTTNLVEVHIRRIRLKLKEAGAADPIKTVRGIGYMLCE